MMDATKVFLLFKELYGSNESDERLMTLCTYACKDIEAKAKQGVDFDDIRLITLACAIVEDAICMGEIFKSDGVASFKAGDVSIKNENENYQKAVKENLQRALISASPLLEDREFTFRQVVL